MKFLYLEAMKTKSKFISMKESFAHYGILGEVHSNIYIADITADGKWILCAHEYGTVVLYKHNFTTN